MACLTSVALRETMVTPIYSSIPLIIKSTVLEAAKYVNIEYIAVSTLTNKAEKENRITLKTEIKSPTDRLVFLLT